MILSTARQNVRDAFLGEHVSCTNALIPTGRRPQDTPHRNPPNPVGPGSGSPPQNLAVLETIFDFVLGPPPPGGPGEGSGRTFSLGDRRFWAGSGPDPGFNICLFWPLAQLRYWCPTLGPDLSLLTSGVDPVSL